MYFFLETTVLPPLSVGLYISQTRPRQLLEEIHRHALNYPAHTMNHEVYKIN